MNSLNVVLIGIVIILGSALVIVILDYNETRSSYDSLLNDKLQVDELIETFKEKYSEHGLREDPDSKGIPYRYTATTNYNSHVELLLEKDRVILREIGTPDGDTICIVINPFPRDILGTCSSKW